MKVILTPAQSEIARDTHRFRVVNIGRRGGKTTLAIEEMLGKAVSQNDNRIAYIAPTYQQARDIAWDQLKKRLRPILAQVNESRLELTVKTKDGGTSLIVLRGWESVETLRGQKFHFIVIDEVAMMRNFWEGWHEVIRPTLTDTRGEVLFISTPKGFNHFYDLYNLQEKDPDYRSFHFTTYDNPLIPVDEINKAKIELPADRFEQEYMANFRKAEGLVYKEFDRSKHVYDDATERGTIVATLQGIDWGYTHNAAVVTIEKTYDGKYYAYDEWVHHGKTEEQAIEYAGSLKASRTYPDPENASAVEKARRAGLNVNDVVKGKGSVRSGIDTVRELFKNNRLFIHKRCQHLITALEVHSYKVDSKTEEVDEEGKDECDALRYPLMMDAANVIEFEPVNDFSLYGTSYN